MATTQELLIEAETAYHELMTGKSARVVVDRNGERMEFTAINADRLRAYILELKGLIANVTVARGPLRPYF